MNDTPLAATDDMLDDLRARLRATRRVATLPNTNWSFGMEPEYLADLVGYWAEQYDWRAHEERLLALPWVSVSTAAGAFRCVHAPARGEAPTVLLLHGWPDSFLRYARVLPLLTDLNVVIGCLPGYPYAPTGPGMAPAAMADVVAAAMAELGYDHYIVSAGDIGSAVAEVMAAKHPDKIAALHLTNVPYTHQLGVDLDSLAQDERQHILDWQAWGNAEGAYARLQTTKPSTLAVGLGDSPAGLAAWIVEKLRSWSDCDGDVESVWPRDDLLTWVTLYWVTGAIGTSFSPYALRRGNGPARIDVPTFFQLFPHDIAPASRSFAERFFSDIQGWDEQPRGGHFGPWERPEAFAANLKQAAGVSPA